MMSDDPFKTAYEWGGGIESDAEGIEIEESIDDVIDKGYDFPESDGSDDERVTDYTRKQGYARDDIEDPTEVMEHITAAKSVADRMETLEKINTKLSEVGSRRRYEMAESDIPDSFVSKRDALGHYYYDLDEPLTRKDAVDEIGADSWWEMSDGGRALATSQLLKSEYPEVVSDMNTILDSQTFAARALLDKRNAGPDNESAYSPSQIEEVAGLIAE